MIKTLYNIYLWYYYKEVKCCYCGNKLYIDKKNYIKDFTNYCCNMSCTYGEYNKKNNITNIV